MPNIKFTYIGDYANQVCDRPEPSGSFIPDWFKHMTPYDITPDNPEGKKIKITDYGVNATAKKCTPMLDSIISGYTVPLWADVLVEQREHGPYLSWRVHKEVFVEHGPSSKRMPAPPGYDQLVLKFLTRFKIKTDPGYSIMVRQPAGHYDLPFYTVPAIVDTDKSVIDNNFPVWIKSGFEGIIEKGTPMAQIFPFKRENWTSSFDVMSEEQQMIDLDKGFSKTLVNNYVKNIWSKKKFL